MDFINRLELYVDKLIRIRERIFEKNRKFVTVKDLFGAIGIQKHTRQMNMLFNLDGYLRGQLGKRNEGIFFWIVIIGMVILLIVGFLSHNTVNKLKKEVYNSSLLFLCILVLS